MSLDVSLEVVKPCEVYSANITHNLHEMAEAANIFTEIWHPEDLGIKIAHELIEPLTAGLEQLKKYPAKYTKLNSPNGWGSYKYFVPFVENYLNACIEFPESTVNTDT